MDRILLRIVINAVALWAAARLIPGITLSGEFWDVVLVAAVFGLVNGLIRPLVLLLSFPVVLLTLGLFTLVVNALMLWLTGALMGSLTVEGFGWALLGSLVISVVSLAFSLILPERSRGR
jgi:putative membrane protein